MRVRGSRSIQKRHSQLRLEGIVASAMDAIITVGQDQRVVLFNPAAEVMFGCAADKALGQSIDQFIPHRFRMLHAEHIRRFGTTQSTNRKMGLLNSISGLRANGEEFPIEASISQVEVDGEHLYTVILRDVTERTATEEALRESRLRMEGIVQSAMDAIITVDGNQRIVLFNPAAEAMFGWFAEEILGERIERLIPERYRATHDEHIRRFNRTGVTSRTMGALGAISGLRSNGQEFPIEASISQVTVGGERLSTVILRDITERRSSEEARGLLAREVDHRAKNALAVAMAMVSLTKAESVEGFAASVRGRIAALGRAHSLLSQSQWRGALLEQVIRDEVMIYARDGQLSLCGPEVTCAVDAVQSLSLMFHELATNAVKYGALSREEGRISVRWQSGHASMDIDWEESGGPPVVEPQVAGFGSRLLSQVAGRQLKARIDFDWKREGLRVRIGIPGALARLGAHAPAQEAPAAKRAAPVVPGKEGSRHVLVVEDEGLVALELSDQLAHLGWVVIGPAATLKEAQQLLTERIDIAVLDINLRGRPVYPLAEELSRRKVPFVFCTGYETVDPEGRFPDTTVLRKPTTPRAVSAALNELLGSQSPGF